MAQIVILLLLLFVCCTSTPPLWSRVSSGTREGDGVSYARSERRRTLALLCLFSAPLTRPSCLLSGRNVGDPGRRRFVPLKVGTTSLLRLIFMVYRSRRRVVSCRARDSQRELTFFNCSHILPPCAQVEPLQRSVAS